MPAGCFIFLTLPLKQSLRRVVLQTVTILHGFLHTRPEFLPGSSVLPLNNGVIQHLVKKNRITKLLYRMRSYRIDSNYCDDREKLDN